MSRFTTGAIACMLALLAACGGDPSRPRLLSTDWSDDQGKSIGEVLARLRGAPPPAGADVVVGVTGDANKLVGATLPAGPIWSYEHALDSRPVVAGSAIVAAGGGETFALDAVTGKRLWTTKTQGLAFVGAGDDGKVTAVSFARGAKSALWFIARSGEVLRKIDTEQKLGTPAVRAGVAFVPWANQYVSAIDTKTGEEIGRVTLRDKVSRAMTLGGGLYFGEIAYIRFDDNIVRASRGQASRIGIPPRELPGTPRILVPGTDRTPAVADARDRDRLFARPSAPGGPLAIDSSRFYASYFRLVFGFDAKGGKLKWTHTHKTDVLGGAAVAGGVVLCDDRGKVTGLSAENGGIGFTLDLGQPIQSCVAHADTLRVPASQEGAKPLVEGIREALSSREATLATAQRLLLREMAVADDPRTTLTFIEVASDPLAAPVLIKDARAALATRRTGADAMIAALGKHYDFLHDVLRTPPVGPMADALLAMNEGRAAAPLASHLLDPQDTPDDVKRAARALSKLASKTQLPQLTQFFAMYRASAKEESVALAVASVAEAILRLDPKAGRARIEAASTDAQTVAAVRTRLVALLAQNPETSEGEKGGKPEGQPKPTKKK